MQIDDLIEVFRKNAETGGFVIDFDGTLSPIVANPHEARLGPGASEVLSGLAGRYEVVAIVSGRRAPDIAGKIAVPGLRYIGLYGAEEWIDGQVLQPPRAPEWTAAARQLAGEAAAYFKGSGLAGCEVELKGMAVSLHFRNAEDPLAAEKIFGWAEHAGPSRRFRVSIGRKVVELRPQGVSKAGAFERLADELKLERAVVAGDDLTDVEAMRRAGEVLGEGALRIGVRSTEEPEGLIEQSDVLVGSTEELLALLERFI